MILARTCVAVALAATFVAGASAQTQPGGSTPPPAAAAPAAGEPATPPAPNAIPVPDMPIIKKQELEGGLIVEDMKIGDGYEVKPGGTVVMHYHLTLKDGGKVVQSSFQTGEPLPSPLAALIQGWQKGIPGMKVGGIRKLTVPAALGWADRGTPDGAVPPNADVVFVVQLVDVLQIEDIKEGEGEPAQANCVAVTAHRIVGADGKELEKVEASKPYIWVPGEFAAMTYGLEGMKPGGKRKIVVPKEMNEANPAAGRTTPEHVALTIEVELIAVRNLGGAPRRR